MSYQFRITKIGQVIFDNGATWDDVPVVTGDEIREYRELMGWRQEDFAPKINITQGRLSQLEDYGDQPVESKRARVRFLIFRDTNPQPALIWEPEHITVTADKIAGYFSYDKCKKCGQGFFNTNVQRLHCMDCAPYDGVGAKK
jgi:hypothetical protein